MGDFWRPKIGHIIAVEAGLERTGLVGQIIDETMIGQLVVLLAIDAPFQGRYTKEYRADELKLANAAERAEWVAWKMTGGRAVESSNLQRQAAAVFAGAKVMNSYDPLNFLEKIGRS